MTRYTATSPFADASTSRLPHVHATPTPRSCPRETEVANTGAPATNDAQQPPRSDLPRRWGCAGHGIGQRRRQRSTLVIAATECRPGPWHPPPRKRPMRGSQIRKCRRATGTPQEAEPRQSARCQSGDLANSRLARTALHRRASSLPARTATRLPTPTEPRS